MKSSRKKKAEPLSQRLKTDFQKNWLLYVMLLPVLIYLIIFCYAPMYGVIIAFKNFKPRLGILGSDWVGLKYFKEFVGSVFFGRTLKNTLMISGLNLLFGFSAPIIFAILLNEVGKLELGAGFNMEYTGVENVYLNGTMLGFTEEEINKRLPEILRFADIGDFVNQPVKTYSSGMFVRLAFAVAINIDPEILIVDEALSVGDVFFQAKCYHRFL